MAISSISSTLIPSVAIPSSHSHKPKFTFLSHASTPSFSPLKLIINTLRLSQSPTKLFAASEALEETPEVGSSEVPISSSVSAEAGRAAPRQKIRIKHRSYWVPLIEDSCKQIMDAARTTNAKTMGPVPLPTKKRI